MTHGGLSSGKDSGVMARVHTCRPLCCWVVVTVALVAVAQQRSFAFQLQRTQRQAGFVLQPTTTRNVAAVVGAVRKDRTGITSGSVQQPWPWLSPTSARIFKKLECPNQCSRLLGAFRGTCVAGRCVCNAGFYGPDCSLPGVRSDGNLSAQPGDYPFRTCLVVRCACLCVHFVDLCALDVVRWFVSAIC